MRTIFLAALLAGAGTAYAAPGIVSADTVRATDGSDIVQWRATHPETRVAIYLADKDGTPLERIDRDGLERGYARFFPDDGKDAEARRFYVVADGGARDAKQDGTVARGRTVPLAHGSNFRDLGGYVGADGKTVRWGKIYRSGAPALLTKDDLQQVRALGIRTTVDLRSNEERELAPSLLVAKLPTAIVRDYSMMEMLPLDKDGKIVLSPLQGYGESIVTLSPLYRQVFDALLKGEGGVHYNCTAGQDRTGVVSALILSALGVSRDQILRDYHLSTELRRPEYEMPKIDPADYPDNKIVQLFAHVAAEEGNKPNPLYGPNGVSTLATTFDMIDERWGSTEGFLKEVLGLGEKELTSLRARYLE